jgi:hypothetical protein
VAQYDPGAVLAGRPDVREVWRIQASLANGIAVSPVRKSALVYPGGWLTPSFTPYLVDLPTGVETPLSTPGEDRFSFGGWLPDGSFLAWEKVGKIMLRVDEQGNLPRVRQPVT